MRSCFSAKGLTHLAQGCTAVFNSYVVPLDSSSFQAEPSCASRSLSILVHCDFSGLVHRDPSEGVVEIY